MSKNSETIYFYFRFHKDFFTSERIRNMKHLPGYGYEFIVIYLELCCLAIENNGYLQIDQTVDGIPYVLNLAKDIGEDPEKVSLAITYFINNGLVEVMKIEKGTEVFIPYVYFNTGRSSDEADKRRIRRMMNKSGNRLFDASGESQGEIKLISISDEECNKYGRFKNVVLTYEEFEELNRKYENFQSIIEFWGRKKKMKNIKANNDYEELQRILKAKGKPK